MILDAGDNPIMAYSDESMLKPASWKGDGWDVETVTGAGADPLGNRSMALDPQGALHLTLANVRHNPETSVSGF